MALFAATLALRIVLHHIDVEAGNGRSRGAVHGLVVLARRAASRSVRSSWCRVEIHHLVSSRDHAPLFLLALHIADHARCFSHFFECIARLLLLFLELVDVELSGVLLELLLLKVLFHVELVFSVLLDVRLTIYDGQDREHASQGEE